jgi:hypothetical protein
MFMMMMIIKAMIIYKLHYRMCNSCTGIGHVKNVLEFSVFAGVPEGWF